MKHIQLFLIAVGALSLASCANDEPLSIRSNDDAISFRSGMASRASETTNANLSSIYVTAFTGTKPYFENANYVKGSDSFFTSPAHYKWLENDETIQFFAYAPSQDELGADVIIKDNAAGMQLESFSVAEDIADQVDFITANASGTRKDNETTGVELTFDHRLSQIEIQAKSENPTYTFKVTGVRIGRPQYVGTFDFNTNTWTLDDWHDTAVYTSTCDETTLSSTPQSIMGKSGNAMLMPQTLTAWNPVNDPDNVAREAYLSVLVQISRTDNGFQMYPYSDDTTKDSTGNIRKFGWVSIPLSGTWEQGKKYIYTLDFTEGAGNVDPDDPHPGEPVLGGDIKFKVDVNTWTDADQDIPMLPVTK
ncbi:MAG: fimbrillin family protein [Muribaculaceae bacterium]|nr:fimbrillin family protein [Muribaculaceae bacterium]